MLLFRNSLQVVDIESGTVFGNMSQKSKINCARCVAVPDSAVMSSTTKTISSSSDTSHREVLIAGCEDGKVVCWSLDGKQVLFEFDTRCSDSRVKDIQVFSSSSSSSIGVFIITCSSNGLIKLWDMKAIIKGSSAVVSPDPLAVYDTKCRLTCIASSHARGGQKYVSAEEEAAAAKTNVSGGNGYVTESEYEGEELARKRTRMSVSIDGEEKNNMNENNGNKCMKKKVFKKRRTETKTNTNRNATSKLVEAGEGEKRKQNMMIKKQKSAKKPTSAKLSAKKEEKRQKFVKKAHASTCADAKVIAK